MSIEDLYYRHNLSYITQEKKKPNRHFLGNILDLYFQENETPKTESEPVYRSNQAAKESYLIALWIVFVPLGQGLIEKKESSCDPGEIDRAVSLLE